MECGQKYSGPPLPEIKDRAGVYLCQREQGHQGPCGPKATPSVVPLDRMLQFFRYEHLPEHLRAVSAPFGKLAQQICENLPSNPERTVALRKLLEAKDCAVRAVLYEG